MDTTASFPVDKSGRKVNLTTYLHLMSISEKNAAVSMFHHVISRHTCAQEQMYPQILGQGTENDRFPKSVQANPKQNLHHHLPPPPLRHFANAKWKLILGIGWTRNQQKNHRLFWFRTVNSEIRGVQYFYILRVRKNMRKATIIFVNYVCPSVRLYICLSARKYSFPNGRVFMKFGIWGFNENMSTRFKFH